MYATMCQPASDQRGFSAPATTLSRADKDFIVERAMSCEYWARRSIECRAAGDAAMADERAQFAEESALLAFAVAEGRA